MTQPSTEYTRFSVLLRGALALHGGARIEANCSTVASTAEEQKAELIILDINFPAGGSMEWSGFTILQWLRRFPELANIPVIFITGAESAKFKERALAVGAIAFFEKPVDFNELLKVMVETLSRPMGRK